VSPLVIIFITVFIDLLGFGIIIPLLPFYAETFGASPIVIGLLTGWVTRRSLGSLRVLSLTQKPKLAPVADTTSAGPGPAWPWWAMLVNLARIPLFPRRFAL